MSLLNLVLLLPFAKALGSSLAVYQHVRERSAISLLAVYKHIINDDNGIQYKEKYVFIIIVTAHAYDTYRIHSSCSAFVVEQHRAILERVSRVLLNQLKLTRYVYTHA